MITLSTSTIVRTKSLDPIERRVLVTKTVYYTIYIAGKGIHSVQDITTGINAQLKANEQITETQVRAVIRSLWRAATCNGAHLENSKVIDLGSDWYEFKRVYK